MKKPFEEKWIYYKSVEKNRPYSDHFTAQILFFLLSSLQFPIEGNSRLPLMGHLNFQFSALDILSRIEMDKYQCLRIFTIKSNITQLQKNLHSKQVYPITIINC